MPSPETPVPTTVILAMDAPNLWFASRAVYHRDRGPLRADDPNMTVAVIIYPIDVAGVFNAATGKRRCLAGRADRILYLRNIRPRQSRHHANLTIMKVRSLRVTLLDIAWALS